MQPNIPCSSLAEDQTTPIRCHKCNKPGHIRRNCPTLGQDVPVKRCHRCNKDGHISRDCHSKCHRCNKEGHLRRDCDAVALSCHNCNKEGHRRRDCPSLADDQAKFIKRCPKCKKDGLIKGDCPSSVCGLHGHVKADTRKCSRCKKEGHVRRFCPSLTENRATPTKAAGGPEGDQSKPNPALPQVTPFILAALLQECRAARANKLQEEEEEEEEQFNMDDFVTVDELDEEKTNHSDPTQTTPPHTPVPDTTSVKEATPTPVAEEPQADASQTEDKKEETERKEEEEGRKEGKEEESSSPSMKAAPTVEKEEETEENSAGRATVELKRKTSEEESEENGGQGGEKKRQKTEPLVPEDYSLPPYDPESPVGLEFLVPKIGFFCKPCSRFYSGTKEAERSHGRSLPHYQNLQKYLQQLNKKKMMINSATS